MCGGEVEICMRLREHLERTPGIGPEGFVRLLRTAESGQAERRLVAVRRGREAFPQRLSGADAGDAADVSQVDSGEPESYGGSDFGSCLSEGGVNFGSFPV